MRCTSSLRISALTLATLGVCACSSNSTTGGNSPSSGGAGGTNTYISDGGSAVTAGTRNAGGKAGTGGASTGGGAAGASGASGISGASAGGGSSGAGGAITAAGGATNPASGGTPSTGGGSGGSAQHPAECLGHPMPPRAYAQFSPPTTLTPYFPTTTFKTATPAEAGMDPDKLATALQYAPAHTNTQGVAVFRNGYIVGERYAAPFTQDTRHESYSMAKGFSSALVGIAIHDGLLQGVDTLICGSYSEWGCDPSNKRSLITLTHAMNVESGLEWHEDWRIGATGTNDAFSPSILDLALSRSVVDDPGTKQRYSTGDPALLSGVLQKATGKTAFEYAKTALLGPIGLTGVGWGSDSKGRTTTHMGVSATVREFAKFGILYLNRGSWDGKQVVPSDWVDFTTQAKSPCEDQYRYLWHINLPVRLGDEDPKCGGFLQCPPTGLADLPANGFFAIGVYGQLILVLPSAGIVIARVAQDEAGSEYWDGYARDIMRLVLDAVK